MIFTRRFGALAARSQFPDAPELEQELTVDVEHLQHTDEVRRSRTADTRHRAEEEAA